MSGTKNGIGRIIPDELLSGAHGRLVPYGREVSAAGRCVARQAARGRKVVRDIKEAIRPETCVKNRNSYGGTSYEQVNLQLKAAKELLASEKGMAEAAREKQI